jgi:hypothetical protein
MDKLISDVCERYGFISPRTAHYYLLYNGILFNRNGIRDTAKMLINKLLDEIANIQDLAKSRINIKKITNHYSDIQTNLRQLLNNWAFIETSARVAVIRALSKTLNNCIYDDWRFIRSYIDNLVMCLHDHESSLI